MVEAFMKSMSGLTRPGGYCLEFMIHAACCNNSLQDVVVNFVKIDGFENVCVEILKTFVVG